MHICLSCYREFYVGGCKKHQVALEHLKINKLLSIVSKRITLGNRYTVMHTLTVILTY